MPKVKCPICLGSGRIWDSMCANCGGSGSVLESQSPNDRGGGGGGSNVTAGSIGFLSAASAAIVSFFFTASFESFATRAIVAAVVFVAIYFTLTKPLRALSSAIAAILNGIFAVVGLLLRIVVFGALAVGAIWLVSQFF